MTNEETETGDDTKVKCNAIAKTSHHETKHQMCALMLRETSICRKRHHNHYAFLHASFALSLCCGLVVMICLFKSQC